MNSARVYKMGSVFLVKVLKIRDMLEIVRVNLTAVYYEVRLYIILKLNDLKLPALIRENLRRLCKDLRVRSRRSRYRNLALRL